MYKKLLFILAILIFGYGIYLRVTDIGDYPGFTGDEAWVNNKAVYINQTSLSHNFFGMGNYTGIVTPGTIYIFSKIFGFSYINSRILSVLFNMTAVIITFVVCCRLYSIIYALSAAALLLFNIFLISYSRIAMGHVWLPALLATAFYLFYYFLNSNKKNISVLLIIIIIMGIAIQILPTAIIFFIFMLSYIFNPKYLKKCFKLKYVILFIVVFILATSSMFVYTSKIVLNILNMNLGYVKQLGLLNITLKLLSRIPEYIYVFISTFSGLRSLLYFSGSIPEFSWIILAVNFLVLLSSLTLIKSDDLKDRMIFRYLWLHFIITPFFLEFFNKNMNFPHLGEERYLMTFYPFIVIGCLSGLNNLVKKKKLFFSGIVILYCALNIYLYNTHYIKIFKEKGGIYGISESRVLFAVNGKPVPLKIVNYMNNNLDNLDNTVIITPGFWLYQPVKYFSKGKFLNLYFWPEKTVPEIWITDDNKLPYLYSNIGLEGFLKKFDGKEIYFLCWEPWKSKYLDRLREIKENYKIVKTFYRKDNRPLLLVFKVN